METIEINDYTFKSDQPTGKYYELSVAQHSNNSNNNVCRASGDFPMQLGRIERNCSALFCAFLTVRHK